MLTLYIWAPKEGGISWIWRFGNDRPVWSEEAYGINSAFFTFGRFGAGYSPFGEMDKQPAKAKLAIERVKEKFGMDVKVVYAKPENSCP